ncbi:MAG: type 4a pilus biogenesis protein PilO [Isosphaeraceae bacterium]
MSQTPSKSNYQRIILQQLAHPVKLRLVLCLAIIVGWYTMFFSPTSEHLAATTTRIDRERKRVATAREIEQLKKDVAPSLGLIPADADVQELMRHVIDHLRSSPLTLIEVKPDKPKDLGPFEAITLQLKVEGRFAEIDEFLGWVEKDRRLMRIDSIKLDPASKNVGRLSAQLSVLSLAAKPETAAKTKMQETKKR